MRHIKLNIFNLLSRLIRNFAAYIKSSLLNGLQSVKANLQLILFNTIIWLLILQAGDVELNPGPNVSDRTSLLSLLHCNIRSIRNKLNFIRDEFLDFNVLCFTETHLNESFTQENLYLSDSFDEPYRKDRTNHGGGILVYLNKDLVHSRVAGLERYCNESIWVKTAVKSEVYLIGFFYSPKTADTVFFRNLNINLEAAFQMSKNVIIMGDLNEDLLNNAFHNLKDIIIVNSMMNVINVPTRGNSLLDPILIPSDLEYSDCGTYLLPQAISDHCATYISIPFPYQTQPCFERTIWLYSRANYELLNKKISDYNWNVLLNGSIDESCATFTRIFIGMVNECIPHKTVCVRPDDQPWYDNAIRRISRKRDRMKSTAKSSGKITDWSKYKNLRNTVNNMKKHAKERFFNNLETNLLALNCNDKRGFWKIIKHFLKKDKSVSCFPPLCEILSNGETVWYTSTQEKADCLNNYFTSISEVDDTNIVLPGIQLKTANKLVIDEVTKSETEDIIQSIEINKASGPDNISHRMLKGCIHAISEPLYVLFNRSISEGVFPDLWKRASVTPLYKKGDKSFPSNYRPVSLLSSCGKILERIIFKHMYNFLMTNGLLYKYQSGFLPKHSTTYQLIDIYHHICQAVDHGQFSCIVFCDISKAFDRVWHSGLLFKLEEHGLGDGLLKWFKSYLDNRKQKVVIQSSESSLSPLRAGVPQGSVLGPLLFLIYVNDITDSLLSLTRLYADDSSLYYSATSLSDIESIVNHDLRIVSQWAKQWLVDFNPDKTEAVIFSTRKDFDRPSLFFGNTKIKIVDEHKHLGLTLSSTGQWKDHINNNLKAASKILQIMRRLQFTLTRAALNQIYLSYVRPILEYSSIIGWLFSYVF